MATTLASTSAVLAQPALAGRQRSNVSNAHANVLLAATRPRVRFGQPCSAEQARAVKTEAFGRQGFGACDPAGMSAAWGMNPEVLNKAMKEFARQMESPTGRPAASNAFPLPVDIEEDTDSFRIVVDLPGVKRSDLKVRVSKEKVLSISAERQKPALADGEQKWRQRRNERPQGRFERKLTLPENADASSVSAKVDQGVLTLRIWKTQKDEAEFTNVVVE